MEKDNRVSKEILDYVKKCKNIKKEIIEPIFIFGEKGVGKSFLIENEIIPSLQKDGNVSFCINANNLKELEEEVFKLSSKKEVKKQLEQIYKSKEEMSISKEKETSTNKIKILIFTGLLILSLCLFITSVVYIAKKEYWWFFAFGSSLLIFYFDLIYYIFKFIYIKEIKTICRPGFIERLIKLSDDKNNILLFFTLFIIPILSLFISSIVYITKEEYWWFFAFGPSLLIFSFLLFCCIYILQYPYYTKQKLLKWFEILEKKFNHIINKDKKHIYIFIDDLNRVIEKEKVYQIYKFIDNLYKKNAIFMKNIIIIYVGEKEKEEKESEEFKNISKYSGLSIYINTQISPIKTELIALKDKIFEGFAEEKEDLTKKYVVMIENFCLFITRENEKLHKATSLLTHLKSLEIESEGELYKFLFIEKFDFNNKKSIIDIIFYIKMLMVKCCYKEAYSDVGEKIWPYIENKEELIYNQDPSEESLGFQYSEYIKKNKELKNREFELKNIKYELNNHISKLNNNTYTTNELRKNFDTKEKEIDELNKQIKEDEKYLLYLKLFAPNTTVHPDTRAKNSSEYDYFLLDISSCSIEKLFHCYYHCLTKLDNNDINNEIKQKYETIENSIEQRGKEYVVNTNDELEYFYNNSEFLKDLQKE